MGSEEKVDCVGNKVREQHGFQDLNRDSRILILFLIVFVSKIKLKLFYSMLVVTNKEVQC